jgi:Zn-dependent M28 family amino/carboxypeptidase
MDYLYEQLVSLGYSVEFRDWSRDGYADRNLIARKPGMAAPAEEVYFVAHVDGLGSGGERYPAAGDNASGVVDDLELARVLSSWPFSRTLVLFFSTGEEKGTLGVQSYLAQLSPDELSAIKYVVDLDMVGYDANGDGLMQLWHGGDPQSLALTQIMSETIKAYQLDLAPLLQIGCG